ncbi:putative methylmalonyl-CoA mutase, mitochondrial [Clarias magur]|uniref:Putative methylmalonyl-CoA mutase, mitochondrial n=1 Tax=Clarias magur TaxID=1594786 RepID=A0A8J4UEL3_CLAMG|nr:putative methylmalonyl-CoA mutase, mitochondrial [Clarias magur]
MGSGQDTALCSTCGGVPLGPPFAKSEGDCSAQEEVHQSTIKACGTVMFLVLLGTE